MSCAPDSGRFTFAISPRPKTHPQRNRTPGFHSKPGVSFHLKSFSVRIKSAGTWNGFPSIFRSRSRLVLRTSLTFSFSFDSIMVLIMVSYRFGTCFTSSARCSISHCEKRWEGLYPTSLLFQHFASPRKIIAHKNEKAQHC